jgi:hypothetical protein
VAGVRTTFRCGCPREPGNTYTRVDQRGRLYSICRRCTLYHNKMWRYNNQYDKRRRRLRKRAIQLRLPFMEITQWK